MLEEAAPLIVRHDEYRVLPAGPRGDGAEGGRKERVATADVGVRVIVARRAASLVEEAGIDGALIESRDRGNRIGLLFLFSSAVTASSFVSGEMLTYAVDHHHHGWRWHCQHGWFDHDRELPHQRDGIQ